MKALILVMAIILTQSFYAEDAFAAPKKEQSRPVKKAAPQIKEKKQASIKKEQPPNKKSAPKVKTAKKEQPANKKSTPKADAAPKKVDWTYADKNKKGPASNAQGKAEPKSIKLMENEKLQDRYSYRDKESEDKENKFKLSPTVENNDDVITVPKHMHGVTPKSDPMDPRSYDFGVKMKIPAPWN